MQTMFSFVFNSNNRQSSNQTSDLQYLVTHVFSPLKVQVAGEQSCDLDSETALCTFADPVYAAAHAYYEHVDDSHKSQWCHILQMLSSLSHPYGFEECLSQLCAAVPGAVCLLPFVDEENTIIFRKQDDYTQYEQLEYKVDFDSEMPETIRLYPGLTIKIPNNVFYAGQFQSELTNLLCGIREKDPIGYTTHRKYGFKYYHPMPLLTGILRAVGRPAHVTHITKSVTHNPDDKLWFHIKVAIQSSLDRSPLGHATYKAFVLFFMLSLANHAISFSLSSNLLHFMSTKILWRFRKLSTPFPNWLSNAVMETCTRLSDILDSRCIQAQISHCTPSPWNPSQLNLTQDVQLSLPRCDEYISRTLSEWVSDCLHAPIFHCPVRGTLRDFLSPEERFFTQVYHRDSRITLYNVEQAIMREIDDWIACVTDVDQACTQLEMLMENYLSLTHCDSSHDPEGFSTSLLAMVELWVALDKLVVNKIPMLARYSPNLPQDLFDKFVLRKTMILHRWCRASQYLAARHAQSYLGSIFSEQFTEHSFPVCYYDGSPHLQDLGHRIENNAVHVALHTRVISFELQCPVYFEAWRSTTIRLMDVLCCWDLLQRDALSRLQHPLGHAHNDSNDPYVPISRIPRLERYATRHPKALISLAISSEGNLQYVIYDGNTMQDMPQDFKLKNSESFTYQIPHQGLYEQKHLTDTSHTSNEVLSAQLRCHADISLNEYIAFGHLRSGGSLQLINILREVRTRSLNFRRHEVHLMVAQASTKLGPQADTGEPIWHQDLQDESFCHALLDELERLFIGVGAGSSDGPVMGIISNLASLLASGQSNTISERTFQLLRNVREKTFDWVNDLLYDTIRSPTNEKCRQVLGDVAAICRSTFDVDSAIMHKLLHSPRDVEIALACALLMRTANFQDSDSLGYSHMLREQDSRLAHALEDVLRDAILADTSNRGVDLAVCKSWIGYRPGTRRWKPLDYPNSHWISCETTETRSQRSQLVHINLLDGSLLVDGRQVGGNLPDDITQHSLYHAVFGERNFVVIPSDLPGMQFVSQFMVSEYYVHFALQGDDLVIQARHKDAENILQLIPQKLLRGDLPPALVEGCVHWLNISTRIIEIRMLGKLWEPSLDNWRIDCASRPYQMTRREEVFVNIHSPTWDMVSCRLRCLEVPENLIITSRAFPMDSLHFSPLSRLFVALPRYGLSFFINDGGDLESCDFKDMIYDDNQYFGTLFGLVNRLVLRSRLQTAEDLFSRCILIPKDKLRFKQYNHISRVMVSLPSSAEYARAAEDTRRSDNVSFHVYKVDDTLGCLTGSTDLESRLYLAGLHAMTSNACRPDPLTGRTGVEEAISLIWLAGDTRKRHSHTFEVGSGSRKTTPTDYMPDLAQLNLALEKIGVYLHPTSRRSSFDQYAVLQEAYLYPSEVVAPFQNLKENKFNIQTCKSALEDDHHDLVYIVASTVDRWCLETPITNDLSSWIEAWGDMIVGDDILSQLEALRSDSSVTPLRMKIYNILGGSGKMGDSSTRRFQLLFSLPAMVYSSKNPEGTLLSTLVAFAKQPHIRLNDPLCCAGHNLLDGYRPKEHHVRNCAADCRRSGWMASDLPNGLADRLLASWPSETVPTASLHPDDFYLARLTASLQPLFTSCYRNFELKNYLSRICTKPTSPPPSPATHTVKLSSNWKTTLDDLLCERPPPKLPPCHRLPRGSVCPNATPPCDVTSLNQIFKFSSLSAGDRPSELQTQYVARPQSSARQVRTEEIHASLFSGKVVRPTDETLRKHYMLCKSIYTESLGIIKKELGPKTGFEELLNRCGQWPRVTPYILFRCLASTSPVKPPEEWKTCLISLALLALELQRARRLLQFAVQNLEEELLRELENEGGDGWVAAEHPDWLLIQLQGNFLIRRVQVDVAKEMMVPRSKRNTVMQVNMGEGKSSVIIPICAAALASGSQLVRVILPKALKPQMLRLLADRLGGLVGMSINNLVIHRSTTHISLVDSMRKIADERGILVMTPEDVLASQLNCVDTVVNAKITAQSSLGQKWEYEYLLTERWLKSLTDNTYVSMLFNGVQKWLCTPSEKWTKNDDIRRQNRDRPFDHRISNAGKAKELQSHFRLHARDILDESDEILHPRFQTIYTNGFPQHLEGFPDRWIITQKVLRLVNRHMSILSALVPHGIKCERSTFGSFPHMRILHSDSEKQLIPLIAEDVVCGRLVDLGIQYLPRQLQAAIYDFMSREDILLETAKMVQEYAQNTTTWEALLLLRGLLADNILLFALVERRWRVDYGLDPTRTMLAVPYRAKDVPAPKAEFGHPDLIIVLTCLSYYYSGLDEEKLRISFEILLEQDDPPADYAIWLEDCASGTLPDSLRDLNTINIRSLAQWEKHIFPLFSRNQGAIDFYLSKIVFPKHAKEYPWKISGSSWNIAEEKRLLVTGFSGTNDAQYLFPTSIHQDDPDHLHQTGTNARVLAQILHPDNSHYMVTADENGERWTTLNFLRMVINQEPKIRVLLDVGAQVLDRSNHALAETWLDLVPDFDTAGAIYLNPSDELVVLTRDGAVRPLSSSPLVQHLDRCVVYLDHAHTRGTDIKFPRGFRAAVTLGVKVTKDHLAQGCMRMRKLGHGHSVMFFAPPEVDCRIRALISDNRQNVTTADILHWAIRETWSDIQRWASNWAQQGMIHKPQHEALTQFLRDELTPEQLTTSWLQPEIKSLVDLYAPRHHPNPAFSTDLDMEIRQRCRTLGVSSLSNVSLDEEQERETFREIERERETERPPEANPAEHFLHPDVIQFVTTGVLHLEPHSTAFRPIFTTLANSSAAMGEARVWSPYILATADFCNTIIEDELFQGRVDQYLRPVQWVLSGKKDGNDVLVVLSPFETDRLMPFIRVSEHVHLHLYVPRTTERMEPSDDLKFYVIPPLPSDWTPPWALIDQLNIFAGQLYLRDYSAYVRLCRFLGIHTENLPEDGKSPILRNWFSPPGAFEPEIELTFDASPLPFVLMLLAIRNRGMDFSRSHMGSILRGQLLTEKDFEPPAPPIVHYGMESMTE